MLAAHLYESPASLMTQRPDVSPALEAVIVRCLGKKPADRFPDVRALEAALAACDPVARWTEQDATEWWRHRNSGEFRYDKTAAIPPA
jgi:serine/threonine-protein kinase